MPQLDFTTKFKRIDQCKVSDLATIHQKNLVSYEVNFHAYRKHVFSLTDVFKDIDQIEDCIWIGTVMAAVDAVKVRQLGITHIVNMALDEEYHDYNDVEDITVFRYGIYDGHLGPNKVFNAAADKINDILAAGGKVLVHCSAGVSRSATAVISYLMLHRGMTFGEALKKLQEKRMVVSPHPLLVRSIIRDFRDKFVW